MKKRTAPLALVVVLVATFLIGGTPASAASDTYHGVWTAATIPCDGNDTVAASGTWNIVVRDGKSAVFTFNLRTPQHSTGMITMKVTSEDPLSLVGMFGPYAITMTLEEGVLNQRATDVGYGSCIEFHGVTRVG